MLAIGAPSVIILAFVSFVLAFVMLAMVGVLAFAAARS